MIIIEAVNDSGRGLIVNLTRLFEKNSRTQIQIAERPDETQDVEGQSNWRPVRVFAI
jgi:hypothetical protein